jgi:putative flavoprotein involved in K+ transport
MQLDASIYRNAAALMEGAVLVVGCGQSGGQIAEDLALAGRRVYLATTRIGRAPRRYRGADIVNWFIKSGLMDVPRRDLVLPDGSIAPRPLLGALHTISLQSLSAMGVELVGRFSGHDDGRLQFSGDVAENVRFADEASADLKRQVDDYISGANIDAPAAEPDLAEAVALRLPDPPIRSLSLEESGVRTIIWCAGFVGDFSWLRLPESLDDRGQPIHLDGVSPTPGVFFAGLDFATSRRSGTILGVAEEAPRLVGHIANRI